MLTVNKFTVGVILILCVSVGARFNGNTKVLRLVHAVFRHGHRTPADTYPTDPFTNETFFPSGWGHLTNQGKQYMYDTGKWLNRRYGHFLGPLYQPDLVWAQTTGVTRTKMTMAMVLAGLFPPQDTAMEWNKNLNWQPIPIFSEPLDEDTLLLVRTPCARYYEALQEVFETRELQRIQRDNEEMYRELTYLTGMDIKTPDDVQSLYSTLRAETEYGLKLPEWTRNYYPNKLLNLTELSYIYNVHTVELQKFKAGPFLQKMISEWSDKRAGRLSPKDQKIYLYTGHDSTIVNVLHALGAWKQQLPVYGIMAIFELLEDTATGQYGISVYLRNSAESGAIPLTISGCGRFCPLDRFIALTRKFVMVDKERECTARDPSFTTPPPSGP
jgi:prostatic aicd phosphatase